MTAWAFAHPWLTTIIALAVIEAIAAPFRWQRRHARDYRPHLDDRF
jgi:hypothetical protein